MPFAERPAVRSPYTYDDSSREAPPEPGLGQIATAAWHLDNDVYAFMQSANEPVFTPKEDFKIRPFMEEYDKTHGTNYFGQFQDNFVGVASPEEALYKMQKINKELVDQDTLARGGWTGVAASMVSGVLSPFTFIPLVGAETRGAQIAKMMATGFLSQVPSEVLLRATQETRGNKDTVFRLATGTALAGIFGAAMRLATPAERAAGEQVLKEAYDDIKPAGLSADVVELQSAGPLEKGARTAASVIDKTKVFTNPVTENINQEEFPVIRSLTQQFSDAGLSMEGAAKGRVSIEGGTLERRANVQTALIDTQLNNFDSAYNTYWFGDAEPRKFANLRADVGQRWTGGKLSRGEFAQEVSRSIWAGHTSTIPEVRAQAEWITKNVLEPKLEEAVKAGLFESKPEVVGDKAYLTRIYNHEAIRQYPMEFINEFAKHFEEKLQERFAKELGKAQKKSNLARQTAEDVERPADEVTKLRQQTIEKIKGVSEGLPAPVRQLEENIADTKELLSAVTNNPQDLTKWQLSEVQRIAQSIASKEGDTQFRFNQTALEKVAKQLKDDIRSMEETGGDVLRTARETRGDLRKRLAGLNKARATMDARRAGKLDRIEGLEDKSISSIERVVRKGQQALKEFDRWSDERLDAEVSKFKNQFADLAQKYDRQNERIAKLEDEGNFHALEVEQDRITQKFDRLNNIAAKLDQVDQLPRDEIRATIQSGLDELVDEVTQINLRRGQRVARLQDELSKLDPALVEQRIANLKARPAAIERAFADQWKGQAPLGVDLSGAKPDFKDYAFQAATDFKDKVLGTYFGLPTMEIMGMERGPELARMMDISSNRIEKFLETDVNEIVKRYVRTMAPDIEISKRFGTLNFSEIIKPAVDELNQVLRTIDSDATLSVEQKAKKSAKTNANFDKYKKNLQAVMMRMRNQRGLPSDPDGWAYRGARIVMDLNVLRQMGMVVSASFPDIGRPIMRYGLTRTFRDGWLPFIKGLKEIKMVTQEAKLALAANDITSHGRSMALRDVVDDMRRGTKLEKGIQYATSKFGIIAAFDYWTQGMKTLTSAVANAKIMDSLAVINGAEGTLTRAQAIKFLAEQNISEAGAKMIWKEVVENGGGAKTNGIWLPQTEKWKNPEAVMQYRQALHREVANTIVTPGVERPLLSDVNTLGRLLYQFKSFGMASNSKIVLAGLQQKNWHMVSGSMASLGLGAISYYLWGVGVGGEAYKQMMNASPEKWADEAIQRSGLMGPLYDVQRVAQNVPYARNVASFSQQKSTRYAGDNLVQALMGPSFDFLSGAAKVVGGIDHPDPHVVHEFRKLLPFQNLMFFRQAVDAVEAAAASRLPERRQ